MKLPFPFLKKNKIDKSYYLAIILDDEKTSSVILEEEQGIMRLIGTHTEHFISPLEELPQDELIKTIDKAISKAEEVLPPKIETHKTIFGVKENWIDSESKKIKKEYLAKLKHVCDSLDLSPIGFMVISEAIANLMQQDEGSPLSAVLVEIGKNKVHATLFRGGRISESYEGKIDESITSSVDKVLKNFTSAVLPSKIIVAHSKDSKQLEHDFTSHEWSKSLPFLHVPHINILPTDYDTKAVAFGASSQMGFEITNLSEKVPDPVKNIEAIEEHEKENDDLQPDNDIEKPITTTENLGENFGFVRDEDVAKHPIEKKIHSGPKEESVDSKTEDKQIVEKLHENHHKQNHHQNIETLEEYKQETDDILPKNENKNILSGVLGILPKISIPKSIKFPSFISKNKNLKLPIIIGALILILIVGLILFYFSKTEAQVILSVKPNIVSQEEDITFSNTAGNDFSEKIIAAKVITTQIDGEVSTPTTGKKDTGDKAKGNVTIYNSDESPANLSSGTEIKSSNGTSFTIDKDVKLASASGDIFSGTKPGTASISVTAKEIGTDSNLPSGTKFTVGGNSSLAAKNDSAFSGGTKKTITVVSKNDIAKLREDLPKKLEKDAISKLSENKKSDTDVLPGFIKTSIVKEDFNKDLDAEAKELKLKATVEYEGMEFSNPDIQDFAKSILKDKYSEDISFADNSLKTEIKDTKTNKDSGIDGKLIISAGLLPKINTPEIKNKIKDKSPEEAKQLIGTLPQVAKSEIKFTPSFGFIASIFKHLPNNITVSVRSDE